MKMQLSSEDIFEFIDNVKIGELSKIFIKVKCRLYCWLDFLSIEKEYSID